MRKILSLAFMVCILSLPLLSSGQTGHSGQEQKTEEFRKRYFEKSISTFRNNVQVSLSLAAKAESTTPETKTEALRPSKYACPVTADLFPEQKREGNALRFIFPEYTKPNLVTRRISIALLSPERQDIEIAFRWIPERSWPGEREVVGSFLLKADGDPNCYFLGSSAGFPLQVPCEEFILTIPSGTEVKEVLFSSLWTEYVSRDCPWPALEKEIREAFEESRQSPQDESKTIRFLSLLEKALPEYDCVSIYGGPSPALLLGDLESIWNWIDYLYLKLDETNSYALRVFAGIFNIIKEGVLAEVMDDHIWRILHNRPLFILRNWDDIKNYKRNIFESRFLQYPESVAEMVKIYRDIDTEDPKYRAAREEIIGILSEKEQKFSEGT